MKNYVAKMKYALACIFLFMAYAGKCDTYTIKFTSDVYPITIKIYRYENNFQQEFIEQIEIKQAYTYFHNVPEFDSYMVYVDKSYGWYFFIWDGDVEIELKTKSVYLSAIKNSPSTTELDTFRVTSQKLIFKEIRDLDTLLMNMNKKGVKVSDPLYDESQRRRNELMTQGPKKLEAFVRNYLKDNPKSYIAIYKFAEIGLIPDKDEQQILRNMPTQLQKNHRYIKIMSQ